MSDFCFNCSHSKKSHTGRKCGDVIGSSNKMTIVYTQYFGNNQTGKLEKNYEVKFRVPKAVTQCTCKKFIERAEALNTITSK